MAEFLKVVNYQDALRMIKDKFPLPQRERVSLEESLNRILAEELVSPEDMPSFNRSTVDGYAVHAEDSFGSSESLPAFLDYIGEVQMGREADIKVARGQCCWIPTGGMLPAGTDAALMVEYTEKLGDDTVLVFRPAGPWENVMQKGEDIRQGQGLFSPGKRLRAQDIGFLASLGISELSVYKPYSIGIISTGDEIVPVERKPLIGEVRDVNSYSLAAAVQSCGSISRIYPLVKDDFSVLQGAVKSGLEENDVLLMSGGSSVGTMDVTMDVLLSFPGAEMLFHGIAVKPGKPTLAVKIGDKLVIGLPGHPVSALMMFNIVCAPALRFSPSMAVEARINVNVASQAGRDDFVPIKLFKEDDEQMARPLLGKSGLMSILSMADGYIHIPYEAQGVKKDERVKVIQF